MENKDLITISQASRLLKVSKDTLRRWEKRKIIKPFRSPTGWRYYDRKQLEYVYSKKPDFNIQGKLEITPSDHPKELIATLAESKPTVTKSRVLIYLLFFFIAFNIALGIFYLFVSR